MNYELAYKIGFHPWEDAADHDPFVETFSELLDREEQGQEPPFGRALDLGTGSAIWAVELARRGWQVTGIDVVDRALDRGRERVREEGVDVRLVHGDVTELEAAGVGTGYDLLLDTGTFHGLTEAERSEMGAAVTAAAAPQATLLLLVWPRRRRPLIRGADRDEVRAAFPQWIITDVVPSHFEVPAILEPILRPDEHWYRLERRGQAT
ncbi:MAG: class I SAM-dependent methyltransferase [Nitriliruptorales bacterium]|nr:class I SAM-dependent methyltransferase [Nitriliruptorales bacterium]